MDRRDSRMSNPNSEQVEAPATQDKRKVDSNDSQQRDEQLKRARGKDKSLRGPKPSGCGLSFSTSKPKSHFASLYSKPMTSRGAAAELLNLEPASFPTYAAFLYKYYATFCEAPGKARVDERMAIRWLADVLPYDVRSQINLGKPLNEVVTELLQLDIVQQSAHRSGIPMVLSQHEQQPVVQWQCQRPTYQPQYYWQMPPPMLQPPPYWQPLPQSSFQGYPDGLIPQPYSTPKYIGVPGNMPLWPPHQYW